MGTRSMGLEMRVVALTLGFALGCGGKYDVGSGETGGEGGESGAPEPGSGGTSGSGQGGTAQGGATASGGAAAGDSSGGFAGASAGSSAGGGSAGGSAPTCDSAAVPLGDFEPVTPDVAWDRLCLFLHGDTRAPFDPLPVATTADWVRDRVAAILAEQFVEDARAPSGLEDFVRDYAFDGNEDANFSIWASMFARPGGRFGDLFARVGDRVSFLSDRDFLVAYPNSTKRGLWMLERFFCQAIPAPPPDIDIEPIEAAPGKTRRQTLEEMVSQPTCLGCHSYFDPLGFSLEHYDTLGEYRTTENGIPIDSSGTFTSLGGGLAFSGIDDLAGQLEADCDVQSCFVRQIFEHALSSARGGAVPSYDGSELAYVTSEFRNGNLAFLPLLQAIATTPAFLGE